VYFYARPGGDVLLVGREWYPHKERVRAAFDSLATVLQARYGAGDDCPVVSDSFGTVILDHRWKVDSAHITLMARMYGDSVGPAPAVRFVYRLGEPRCEQEHQKPM
jgi:hypothetical protein